MLRENYFLVFKIEFINWLYNITCISLSKLYISLINKNAANRIMKVSYDVLYSIMKNATSKGYIKHQYLFNALRVRFHVQLGYDNATFSDRLIKNSSDQLRHIN